MCRSWQISQGKLAQRKPEGVWVWERGRVGNGEGFLRRDRDRWRRGESYASSGRREIGWEIVGMRYECEKVCAAVGEAWRVSCVEGGRDRGKKTDEDNRRRRDRHLSFTLNFSVNSHLLSLHFFISVSSLYQPDQVALKSCVPCVLSSLLFTQSLFINLQTERRGRALAGLGLAIATDTVDKQRWCMDSALSTIDL